MDTDGVDPVALFSESGSKISEAACKAQNTFGHFWRELVWDRRRAVPVLELACVKLPFFDKGDTENVEHMWISEIEFDGRTVRGKLINQPSRLKNFKVGRIIKAPFSFIEDWLYAINNLAYGGYTIDVFRSRMSPEARKQDDLKWGLDFGKVGEILLTPPIETPLVEWFSQLLASWGSSAGKGLAPYPAGGFTRTELSSLLKPHSDKINVQDENGWSLLHIQSLAGCLFSVDLLLENGADISLKTKHGMTARDLAEVLKWDAVVDRLKAAGAW